MMDQDPHKCYAWRPMVTTDYQAVLTGNLRRLRSRRGWTQVELASRARQVGLGWTLDTVVNLESGRRSLNVGEALLIPQLLGSSFVKLASLDKDDPSDIRVEGSVWPAKAWRIVTEGGHLGGIDKLLTLMLERDEVVNREVRNGAEKKAARALGMSAENLVLLAHNLWYRGLTDERDARVSSKAGAVELSKAKRQALRGHITRTLLAELRVAIEAHEGRA
jgi:transcriptional regulator with XRE-family HTH domain